MQKALPVMILNLFYPALTVARSLGRKGIKVFGIDSNKSNIGVKSRYITYLNAPYREKSLINFLLNFAAKHKTKFVLFPLSDDFLLFVSHYEKELSSYYLFPSPTKIPLKTFILKSEAISIFEKLNIPIPKTVVLKKYFKETDIANLSFPIVLKPDLHERWLNNPIVRSIIGPGNKVILITNITTCKKLCQKLLQYDTIVAQEYIPGTTENLYYYVGYRNVSGKVIVSFIGRKLRTLPDTLGSETLIESIHHPELCKLGEKILSKLNYRGPAGIDFKFDPRDCTFKVIEINFRIGISDELLLCCGIDLPYIYYLDSQGLNTSSYKTYKTGVVWYWFEKDLEWYREYRKKKAISTYSWLKHWSVKKHAHAAFAKDDLKPFFYMLLNLSKRYLKGLVHKIAY